jgi:hypothetical protein
MVQQNIKTMKETKNSILSDDTIKEEMKTFEETIIQFFEIMQIFIEIG